MTNPEHGEAHQDTIGKRAYVLCSHPGCRNLMSREPTLYPEPYLCPYHREKGGDEE